MDRPQISPHFISTPQGHLYAVHYAPPASMTTQGYIIHIPAFAEEMNKSRHIVSHQAREMAQRGWQVVVFDFLGTGDSEGLLIDVDWSVWLSNVQSVVGWLVTEPLPVVLWGLRLGATLAVDYINRLNSQLDNIHLLMWQPIVKGQPFIQQFLRLRLAADIMGSQSGETVKSLREQLAKEGELEVAGYLLPYALTKAIDLLDLTQQHLPPQTQVIWLEMVRDANASLTLPSQKTISAWQQSNTVCQLNALSDPFWSTQELATGAAFIDQTNKHITHLIHSNTDKAVDSQLEYRSLS